MIKHAPRATEEALCLADVLAQPYDIRQQAFDIAGVGSAASVNTTQTISARLTASTGHAIDLRGAVFSDNINRSIISGSYLEDMYGADVCTVRRCITWKDGSETPIQRVNA